MKTKIRLSNRILSLVLGLVMVLSMLPMTVLTAHAADSGICGDNLTYSISNGTLTISGTGAMTEYEDNNQYPWYDQKDSITAVVVNSGVTSIGRRAFYYYGSLETVTINGNTALGPQSFGFCDALTSVEIKGNGTGVYAFHSCTSLTTVKYNGTITDIDYNAFDNCESLSSFTLREGVGSTRNGVFYKGKNITMKLVDANGTDKTEFYSVEKYLLGSSTQNRLTIYGDLSKGAIGPIADQQYTGSEIKPDVIVTWNGQTVSSENYDVSYTNNIELGTATVTVEGKGDYTGTLTKTFLIKKTNISNATVTFNPEDGIYNGVEQKPAVSVVWNDMTLVEGTDYTLSWDKTGFTNADSYTATITGTGNFKGTKTAVFSIGPVDINDATVTLDQNTFVYDETEHKPKVTVTFKGATLREGIDYKVTYQIASKVAGGEPTQWFGNGETSVECIDAGDEYYAVVEGIGNYYTKDRFTLYAPFVIEKAIVTEPTIASKPYDDTVQTADITDTELYTVTEKEGGMNVGEYDVVLTLKDSKNYKWSTTDDAAVTLTFEITKATNEWMTTPNISGWTYGENAKVPVGIAKFGDIDVQYTGTANDGTQFNGLTAPTKAGNYTATFTVEGTENYSGLSKQVNFTIAKANYNMSGAKWDYTEAFKYDGKEHKVEVIGLPDGVIAFGYSDNTAIQVGEYTAVVSLDYDHFNYNKPFMDSLFWSIENDWTPTEYAVSAFNENGWRNTNFIITAANGYKVSLTNTADGTWEDKLTYTNETADGIVTFYLRNEDDGTISLAKTENYKLDNTPATGEVEFVERKSWQKFVNTITFGLFYNTEVTVKATATDNLSGIDKIEYTSSNKPMTLDEVMEITDWKPYSDSFGVDWEEAKQFVYFIRITDNAGNVSYISTDGAEYDNTAPVISGIENGKTYFTTQKVTVIEKNIDNVTLNGNPAAETIMLDGNVDMTYTIVAKDKAGNETTVTVTMKPITTIGTSINDITEDEVKSTDRDTIQEVIDQVDELLTDDDLTDEEKAALEQIKSYADNLIKKIDEAANATNTENTQKVADVTAENVTPEDKTNLENAKADLEKALEDYGDNYTDDEKKAIEDEIKRIDDALEVVENVEAVEELINKLPENITKDDEAAIKAADDAYNALSDYEKSLVDDEVKKALDDAKADLAELNNPVDSTSPNTGNNSNLWMWFVLLFVGGGITFAAGKKLRRLNK